MRLYSAARAQRAWDITAHHEAGHAVVCVALDLPIECMRVGVEGTRKPRLMGFTDGPIPDPPDLYIVSCLAGYPAEATWYNLNGYDPDAVTGLLESNSASDMEQTRDLMCGTGLDGDELAGMAAELVTDNWGAVLTVVDGLADAGGYLSGDEVYALIG